MDGVERSNDIYSINYSRISCEALLTWLRPPRDVTSTNRWCKSKVVPSIQGGLKDNQRRVKTLINKLIKYKSSKDKHLHYVWLGGNKSKGKGE